MGEFACRIGTEGGIVERSVVAASAGEAREQLAEQGLEVFAVRRRGGWLPRLGQPRGSDAPAAVQTGRGRTTEGADPGRRLFAKRAVPAADLLLLTEELAALFRAGLPLLKCVDILKHRRSGTPAGGVLDRVRERIAGGSSLSAAFGVEDPSVRIPRLFVTSVGIGESSGDLEGALRRYAQHLDRALTLRGRVRGALLYPAALFSVSLGVIAVLIGFVLPRFADFYASYQSELPLPTRVLMGVAGLAQGKGALIGLAIVAAGVGFLLWLRSESGRTLGQHLALRVPLAGSLRRLYLDVETSRTMATLLRGGVPLTEALRVAAEGTDNVVYRGRLHHVHDLVSGGTSLHQALEINELMDPMGLEMVDVGESTGTLEDMLGHVAESYDEMLERRLNTFVGLLEPAVLVIMGIFLAAVLLSLYLPLFNVVQVVG